MIIFTKKICVLANVWLDWLIFYFFKKVTCPKGETNLVKSIFPNDELKHRENCFLTDLLLIAVFKVVLKALNKTWLISYWTIMFTPVIYRSRGTRVETEINYWNLHFQRIQRIRGECQLNNKIVKGVRAKTTGKKVILWKEL